MKSVLLSPAFLLLTGMNFFFFTGLNLLNVIPPYLESLGASKAYVGLFMNVNSLALVLFVAPLTRFTDHWGRKRLLLGGYIITFLSLGLQFLLSDNLVGMIAARFMGTFVFCLAFTIHGAEAFELLPREKRASGAAIFGISGLLSNPAASYLGEAILNHWGAPWLFPVSALCLLGAFFLVLFHRFHKPEVLPARGAFFRLIARPELRILLVLTLVFGGGFTIFSTYLASLTRERLGLVQISVFFSSFTAVAVAGRLFFSQILDKWPKNILAALCFALIALALAGGVILQDSWVLVPMGMFYGLGHSLLFPLLSTLFVNTGQENEKLGMNSLFAATNTLGNFLWGFLLGGVGDLGGTGAIFAAMGSLVILAIPLAWWGLGVKRQRV